MGIAVIFYKVISESPSRNASAASPSNKPAPAPFEPIAISDLPDPSVEPPREEYRTIRILRPDGSYDLIAETPEVIRRRAERREMAKARFEGTKDRFRDDFYRKESEEGAGAAFAFLLEFLRNPGADIDDVARVYAAGILLIDVLQGIDGAVSGASPYKGFRAAAISRLEGLLREPSANRTLKRMMLSQIGRLGRRFIFAGDEGTREDGVNTYNPSAPFTVLVSVQEPAAGADASEKPNPLLSDPAVFDLLLRVALEPAGHPHDSFVRNTALLALRGVPDALEEDQLIELAKGPDKMVQKSAVYLLSRRTEGLPPTEFMNVLRSQTDPIGMSSAIERLGVKALAEPEAYLALHEAFSETLPKSLSWRDNYYRTTVLRVAVDAYEHHRKQTLLQLLTGYANRWATEKWGSDSPLVLLAERAAAKKLREFVPILRSHITLVDSAGHRVRIEKAIEALEADP